MEQRGEVLFSTERASAMLKQLGYSDLNSVPIGRGNDYLTALVRIVEGGI